MPNYSYTIIVTECAHELDAGSTARVCKYCGAALPFNRDWTWVQPVDFGTGGWGLYRHGINGWDLFV